MFVYFYCDAALLFSSLPLPINIVSSFGGTFPSCVKVLDISRFRMWACQFAPRFSFPWRVWSACQISTRKWPLCGPHMLRQVPVSEFWKGVKAMAEHTFGGSYDQGCWASNLSTTMRTAQPQTQVSFSFRTAQRLAPYAFGLRSQFFMLKSSSFPFKMFAS